MTDTDDVALLELQVAVLLILHLRFCLKYIYVFVAVFLCFHSMAYWTTRRCATSRIANSTTSQLEVRTARGLDKSRFKTTRGLDDSQHAGLYVLPLFLILYYFSF